MWVWVKIRYPNNWMVNTKLDFSICGPLNGLPFWPTSMWVKSQKVTKPVVTEAETNHATRIRRIIAEWPKISGGFVWKCRVPLHPMVLLIIIPTKWLFHWGYTPFSDIPRLEKHDKKKPDIWWFTIIFHGLQIMFPVNIAIYSKVHPFFSRFWMKFWENPTELFLFLMPSRLRMAVQAGQLIAKGNH